jgi:hypothetical protein
MHLTWRILLVLAAVIIFAGVRASGQRCVSQERLSEFLAKNSAASEFRDSFEEFTRNSASSESIQSRTVVNIPVVFHVVWRMPVENISDEQILSQLNVLNRDFRLTNNTNGLLPAIFQPFAADVELNFCLAQRTPEGFPTNGIVRVNTQLPFIGDRIINGRKIICYNSDGGSSAWDVNRYLNVWIGSRQFFPAEASFPGGAVPEEDGIIISPKFVGTTGTAAPNMPYHLGRTLTHEIGHYLNLFHLWGSGLPGSCTQSDGVADTPVQSRTYISECPAHPQISCGSADMFMNFMNYTDDACMIMFTLGQKDRIWTALNLLRAGLLSSDGCVAPASTSSFWPKGDKIITLVHNPVRGNAVLKMKAGLGIHFAWRIFTASGYCNKEGYFLGQDQISLNLEGLSTGLYFLEIRGAGIQVIEKLVVVY